MFNCNFNHLDLVLHIRLSDKLFVFAIPNLCLETVKLIYSSTYITLYNYLFYKYSHFTNNTLTLTYQFPFCLETLNLEVS